MLVVWIYQDKFDPRFLLKVLCWWYIMKYFALHLINNFTVDDMSPSTSTVCLRHHRFLMTLNLFRMPTVFLNTVIILSLDKQRALVENCISHVIHKWKWNSIKLNYGVPQQLPNSKSRQRLLNSETAMKRLSRKMSSWECVLTMNSSQTSSLKKPELCFFVILCSCQEKRHKRTQLAKPIISWYF